MFRFSFSLYFSFVILFFVNLPLANAGNTAKPNDHQFDCNSVLYKHAVDNWTQTGHPLVKVDLIEKRLIALHDTYALYDAQVYISNTLSMAYRCNDRGLLSDIAQVLLPAFNVLEIDPVDKARKWICRGGAICNKTNGLVDKEVQLVSLQFLGLISELANAIDQIPRKERSDFENDFLKQSTTVIGEHLLRWNNKDLEQDLLAKMKILPDDIKDGSSKYFFTDKELWLISIIAETSGTIKNDPDLFSKDFKENLKSTGSIDALFKFFKARITLTPLNSAGVVKMLGADIDSGYWQLYADNHYAGYSNVTPPVHCVISDAKSGTTTKRLEIAVPVEQVKPVKTIGWDFSHGRRLVHTLDAIDRNRQALGLFLNNDNSLMPDKQITKEFAANLVGNVWNQDKTYPLFSNFLNGSNGWYRVAYDNGTGDCREGYPPFGMTDSFPTGGYATWNNVMPIVGQLARRIYFMSLSDDQNDKTFMEKYYPSLSDKANARSRSLAELMFLPSLLGTEKF